MNEEFRAIVGPHSVHWNYSKAETLEKLEQWIETQLIEASLDELYSLRNLLDDSKTPEYRKLLLEERIRTLNAKHYNKLMDLDGVDDRRDNSAQSEYKRKDETI